jgi:hypothetical protein
MERRRSPRAKCRFPCELVRLRERTAGTVLDVSEGGLSVRTQLEVDQGEPLLVRIQVPNQDELELEAMVWHVRRTRQRNGGEPHRVLGLMVSKAPDAYFALVPSTTPDEGREPDGAPEAESSPLPDPGSDSTGLRSFHIRIKARSGPRTRVLSLSADSEDEARALALDGLDGEWELLEVREA